MTFKYKDYREKGRTRHKTMTLVPEEFIRRFLLHVLPSGLHRIRHYGLLANASRKDNLVRARELLDTDTPKDQSYDEHDDSGQSSTPTYICPSCAAPMIIIEVIARGHLRRAPPASNAEP